MVVTPWWEVGEIASKSPFLVASPENIRYVDEKWLAVVVAAVVDVVLAEWCDLLQTMVLQPLGQVRVR